ncbi:MAG: hypothetical protein HC793_01775 [Aquincola sp.]|nr:hypothetical protein [Aquincola sp.]
MMRLDDWLEMYRVYLAAKAESTPDSRRLDSSSSSASAKSSTSESSLPFMS